MSKCIRTGRGLSQKRCAIHRQVPRGWNTKVHMVAADGLTAVKFSLSPDEAHDAPEGRKLLRRLEPLKERPRLLMDRAYEGDETRQLALDLDFEPVVPTKKNRTNPWEYDQPVARARGHRWAGPDEGCWPDSRRRMASIMSMAESGGIALASAANADCSVKTVSEDTPSRANCAGVASDSVCPWGKERSS